MARSFYRVWTPTLTGGWKGNDRVYTRRWQAHLAAWRHDVSLPRDSHFRGAMIQEKHDGSQ